MADSYAPILIRPELRHIDEYGGVNGWHDEQVERARELLRNVRVVGTDPLQPTLGAIAEYLRGFGFDFGESQPLVQLATLLNQVVWLGPLAEFLEVPGLANVQINGAGQDVILEYPGLTVTCQYREATAGRGGLGMGGLTFSGTNGCLPVSRAGFELSPDPMINPNNVVAGILGVKGHPVGGPQLEPEEAGRFWTTPEKDDSGDAIKDYSRHMRNFLDCVKSRQEPVSDLQSGHEIATACHLSNISLKTGRKLVWDAEKEEVVGDREANAMLVRPYRAPWDKELQALGVS